MKRICLFSIIAVMLFSIKPAMSQENVVKLNLPSLSSSSFYVSYERVVNESMSAQLGVSFRPAIAPPGSKYFGDSEMLSGLTMSGLSFTPEFRFYLSGSKEGPRGFYMAPYIRYSKYTLASNYSLSLSTLDPSAFGDADITMKGGLSSFGFGAVLAGWHWLIKDKVSIDLSLVSGHYYLSKVSFELESEDLANQPINLFEELGETIEDGMTMISGAETEVTSSSAKVSVPVKMGLPRFIFSVGYAF